MKKERVGSRIGLKRFAVVFFSLLLLVILGNWASALAGESDQRTSWDNFFPPDGETGYSDSPLGYFFAYTVGGFPVYDEETSSDSSHGSAAVPPSSTDLASASPGSPPGPKETALYGYFNGGTPWDPENVSTMNDDFIMFRFRLTGDPSHSTGFDSYHWNVLFDIDGDGYKEYWIDTDGTYKQNSSDLVRVLYENTATQVIPTPFGAYEVDHFTARNDADTAMLSHTRVLPTTDGSGDYLLDVQVPMTAFKDLNGNQLLFPDSPVAFVYSTGTNNNDPLQKDWMTQLDANGGSFVETDPIIFGDPVNPNGSALIQFTDQTGAYVDFYNIGDSLYAYVHASAQNSDSNVLDTLMVTFTDPVTGDDEEVVLIETGPDTSIFTNRGSATRPVSQYPSEASIPFVRTFGTTVAENWTLTYNNGSKDWNVVGSVSGPQGTATVDANGIAAFTSTNGSISFILSQYDKNKATANSTITFSTLAATPIATSILVGGDNSGSLQVASGHRLEVTFVPPDAAPATDTAYIYGTGVPFVQFTRSTGLPNYEFRLTASTATSEPLYVTVSDAVANTNPATQQTIQVIVNTPGGDSETITLTETGVDTGVFRNATGLLSKVSDGATAANDGLWEGTDSQVITATYTKSGTGYTGQAATLYVDAGGRVRFTNSTGSADVNLYAAGDPVYVEVRDGNANTNVATLQTVTVTVTSAAGDAETLTLTETGVNTGVFRSVVPATLTTVTYDGATTNNDNALEAADSQYLTASYVDANDGDLDSSNNTKTDTALYNAPAVVVNRVFFQPEPGTTQTEFIELYNASTAAVNIYNYQVTDGDGFTFAVPELDGAGATWLGPGETARIYLYPGSPFADFRDSADLIHLFAPASSLPANELGDMNGSQSAQRDQVLLYDGTGTIVDYVAWSGSLPQDLDFQSDDQDAVDARIWPDNGYRDVSAITDGKVLYRITAGVDTDKPADWTYGPVDPLDFNFTARVALGPNGAASGVPGSTVLYHVTLTNTGSGTDRFDLRTTSEQGWAVQLLTPAGVTIATDAEGDGTWESIAVGYDSDADNVPDVLLEPFALNATAASVNYQVRVTIPAGAVLTTTDTTILTATSRADATKSGTATLETLVVDSGLISGTVVFAPDQSGIAAAGDTVVYVHTVTNNTGTADTFDLAGGSSEGWSVNLYEDTNDDGAYGAGDAVAGDTGLLADGASKTIFAVIAVEGGAPVGAIDATYLSAVSQTNSAIAGFATDTTTIQGTGGALAALDMSGGGTVTVTGGTTAVFPGTFTNRGDSQDSFTFTISAADNGTTAYFHPTEFWFDTDGNGALEQIATDADGDGVWDNGVTAVIAVPAGVSRPYELRRAVDAGQTPYRDPVTLTATSGNDITVVAGVTATNVLFGATRAVIGSFTAASEEGGVVIRWETLSEHNTLGFYLLRQNGAHGAFQQVNDTILPGLLHSPAGGVYTYVDKGARPGRPYTYLLVEKEFNGAEHDYGPFTVVADPRPQQRGPAMSRAGALPGYTSEARSIPAAKTARRQAARKAGRTELTASTQFIRTAQAEPTEQAATAWKIAVRDTGLHYLDALTIAARLAISQSEAQGLIRENHLAITNNGEPVATHAADGAAGLYFYGQAIDSRYTRDNIYRLTVAPGLKMVENPRKFRGPAPDPGSFTDTVRVEENHHVVMGLVESPAEDFWMWDYLMTGSALAGKSFSIRTPGVTATGPALLAVMLFGAVDAPAAFDNHVIVRLNGATVDEVEWDGTGPMLVQTKIDSALLLDGDNLVELQAIKNDGVEMSIVYVNWLELQYPRFYRAENNSLAFNSNGKRQISVDGFTGNNIMVLDITDPQTPILMEPTPDQPQPGRFRASFMATPGSAYLAVTGEALLAPQAITADVASDLKNSDHAVDYLVIAADFMLPAAQRLADYRAGQGLRTMAVSLEDIYDEFNHSIRDVESIRTFLRYAHDYWTVAPRYVVLAGEGSYDYKNYLGAGDSVLPSALVSTPSGIFVSDTPFALLDGNDDLPDVAIGRIPVLTEPELDAFVAKLEAYESSTGAWRQSAILVADKDDLGGDFLKAAETAAARFPAEYDLKRLYLENTAIKAARSQLLAYLGEGAAFTHFVGHAGFNTLGNETLLTQDNVASLQNGANLPILAGMTCLINQFGFPTWESLGESLVVKPDGGAMAVWAPTGLSWTEDGEVMADMFYWSIFENGAVRLGDAVLAAQREYGRVGPAHGTMLDTLNLLGDPATLLDIAQDGGDQTSWSQPASR